MTASVLIHSSRITRHFRLICLFLFSFFFTFSLSGCLLLLAEERELPVSIESHILFSAFFLLFSSCLCPDLPSPPVSLTLDGGVFPYRFMIVGFVNT